MTEGNGLRVAVVGATGAVGEAMLDILAGRDFPVRELHVLASARSAGRRLAWKGREHVVEDLATFDFSRADVALFSAGGDVSGEHAPRAAAAGCVVIDNTSKFRYDDDVPLVVPEVNAHAIAQRPRNIIANPNCSTIQLLVALAPLHRASRITRVQVATYQAVSGAGRKGIDELDSQTRALLAGEAVTPAVHGKPIGFNAVPHIDTFQDNGYTREEMKMVWETRKILEDPEIGVNPTCVRVPVFTGHSEAVTIETEAPLGEDRARTLLSEAPGITVIDERCAGGYPTALTDAAGTDPVYVGRIRRDLTSANGLNLWIVSDNVRKGAALNSIQIAEHLLREPR